MKWFMFVVTLHFLEHIAQIIQLYVFKWLRPNCVGILGLWYPWLIQSEWLHYIYAVFMLVGLIILKKRQKNRWWTTAIHLQQFHHFEHLLLLVQAIANVPMANRVSIGSLFFSSRIELHFFYNLMVMIPIVISIMMNLKRGVSI